MKKFGIATVIGMVLVVLGTGFGIATGSVGIDVTGMATVLLGAGVAIFNLWKNRNPEKPKWMGITTVVMVAAGAVVAGLSGFNDEAVFGDILGAVVAVVASIIGLLLNKKKVEAK